MTEVMYAWVRVRAVGLVGGHGSTHAARVGRVRTRPVVVA